jgi:uncharacterized protein (DUF2336 family)
MSYTFLLDELEVAVKVGSPEKREETLMRITSLFLDESDRLNEQQIGVFGDVLVHLIQKIETKALVQLSKSLAPVNNAPIEVIRHLSRHDKIKIAGPVLTQSNRLTEGDLIEVAKSKGQGHLLAISGRASLPQAVTDVLVERGDVEVCHALAGNSGAQFSEVGFATFVKKSDGDERLAERLGLRLDIPFQLLRQLLARATDLVRSRLLAAASPENQEQIQRALGSIANELGQKATRPCDFARADSLAHELNRCGQLTEAALVEFVKAHKHEETTATLALFSGVKSALIERLLKNMSHKELVVACRAGNLTWPTAALILKSPFAYHSISQQELNDARDAFLELSRAAAQESMRSMQVQGTAKAAG